MVTYTFIARMNEGLVRFDHSDDRNIYGVQIWTRRKLRKACECGACQKDMAPGAVAYGPLTNGYNRMARLCEACVALAEANPKSALRSTR